MGDWGVRAVVVGGTGGLGLVVGVDGGTGGLGLVVVGVEGGDWGVRAGEWIVVVVVVSCVRGYIGYHWC